MLVARFDSHPAAFRLVFMDTPEFLGPYRIGKKLGRGGMGTVFDAVHEKSKQRVAVKLIAEHVADEMRFRRRFHTEVETLKRLKHPNIVRLIGYGEEKGQLFYSMELVQGQSLLDRIKQEKKLSWMVTLDIAIQVCSALKHAHDLGVIHRDIKPANLILSADDQVKMVDFGIAKIFGFEQTAEGSVMGTADYMAPEQATGSGITTRSDLYALGCVMYAMLVGRPPFRGKSITEVIAAVKTKDPVPLELVDPNLPDDVVQIVHELLAKSPQERPPTALAVMNRLKAMRAGLHKMMTITARDGDTSVDALDSSGSMYKRDDLGTAATEIRDAATEVPGLQDRATGSEPPGQTMLGKVDPSAGTVHLVGNTPQDRTKAGDSADSFTLEPGSVDADTASRSQGGTHFQTVAEGEYDHGGFFRQAHGEPENPYSKWASLVTLVLALIVAVGAVVYAFQKPNAENLLSEIDLAIAEERLEDAQDPIDRFLKLHGDHPRFDEMKQLRLAFLLEREIRQIRRRVRKNDPDQVAAHEPPFLAAMDLRETDPQTAREKLEKWMSVFVDSDTDPISSVAELAELADFEIARLRRENPEAQNDARLDTLLGRVQSASALPSDEALERLAAIVDLYADVPWAEQAVQSATQQITILRQK